ncbi:MAG: AsmA family protein [Pseudomonadota bacterium]
MTRPIRLLLFAFSGLIGIAILAAVLLFVLIDPNRYRPTIEQVVSRSTGLDLEIAGDIGWSFRPTFGLTINDVRLANPAARQELASFSEISTSLVPGRLVRGELVMEELIARDLHLNWYVNADGESNWLIDMTQERPATEGPAEGDPVSLDIRRIDISNASLAYRDERQGIDARLENLNISSENTNLGDRPFPLDVNARLLDYAGGRELQLALRTEARIDPDAGNILLDSLRFTLSPMTLEGRLAMEDFRGDARWEGELSSNRFNLFYLLETLAGYDAGPGIELDDNQVGLQAEFSGDGQGATVSRLDIDLDGQAVSLSGDVLYPRADRPLTAAYRLDAGELDLDAWLPAPDPDTADEADPSTSDTGGEPPAPLPFDQLAAVNLRGDHRIDSLQIGGLRFTDIEAGLTVADGLLDLQLQPVGLHGGTLASRVQIDSTTSPPRLDSRITAENINAPGLSERFPLLRPFTGRLDLDTEHSATGETVDGLLDSLTGLTRFGMSEGTADITLIKRVFDAISVLSPDGDMTGGWPDRVEFTELEGQWLLAEGLADGQEVTLRMDNFDLNGSGGILLDEQRFDYRFDFTVLGEPTRQMIRIDPDYQDVAWPVRCDADFDARPREYCSPDLQRVREVFTQIARDEVERRARDAVSDQVDSLRDRARGLLDRLQ